LTSANELNSHTGRREHTKQLKRFRLHPVGLSVSERRLLLIVIDIFLLCIALIFAVLIRTELLPNFLAVFLNAKWYVTLALVWAIMGNIFDVYSLARSADAGSIFFSVAGAVFLADLLYLGIPWLTPPLANRSYGILFIMFSLFLVSGWRIFYAIFFVQPAFERRSLVVGAGESGQALVNALSKESPTRLANPFLGTGHRIVGFVDDEPDRQGQTVAGLPVLGDSKGLMNLVESLDVDEVVIAITNSNSINHELYEAILDCRERGLPIVTMPTIYERLTGRVAIEHSGLNIELASGQADNALLRMFYTAKRLIDMVGALSGIFFTALLVPVIAIGNRFWSPGPLFFRQERLGLGGRTFRVIKFRSMIPEAEKESGAVWAAENDLRVTGFGKFLRNTHLDEFPQFINVLRGEMSLVGPRPERPEFVGQLSKSVPFYRARHSVRPGITGWAQIHQDYGDSIELAKEKLEYDLYYIKRAGFRLDTVIMLRTIPKVLGLQGR